MRELKVQTMIRGRDLGLTLAGALLVFGSACARPTEPAGDLNVAVVYELASLDPHLDNSFEAFSQVSNLYEALVNLDRDLGLVPALAVSWSNPDATTWAFRLRPGVRFHDGSLLTAEDVVYSVMRLKQDQTLEARTLLSEVTGATVENGEVVLRTGRPSARLLNDLSGVLIVRTGSTRESLEAHPNGTGPYAFESWTPRQRLKLRRYEGYWGARPTHARVLVEMSATDEQAAAGLREGRLSVVAAASASAERAASEGSRYRLVRQPSLFLWHLGFNLSSPTLPGTAGVPNPFRRLEVRQAIDLALDRSRIAAAGSPGAVPASHIIPKAVFGHDPGRPASVRDIPRARRLLEVAGYPHGFEVDIHSPNTTSRRVLDEVRAQLAEIGIRVAVAGSPTGEDFLPALRNGKLGFWLLAYGSMTGDSVLSDQFHSRNPVRNLGLDNFSGYANPDLDRLIEDADVILDPSMRLPALQKAVRQVEDQHLSIPLYHNRVLYIVDRALTFEPRADLLLRYAEIGQSPPVR